MKHSIRNKNQTVREIRQINLNNLQTNIHKEQAELLIQQE